MKHCRTVKLLFGVSLALLSGCASVGPEPRLLADELQYAETVKNRYKADGNWWRQYNDPELNNLIETALANNPDYLKAAFNVEKELAGLGLATADLFPTLSGELSASSQRKIHTGDDFTDSFSGDLGLSYEADLYGKIRNRQTAQEFAYKATVMDREAARLTLVNSVIDLYFNLEYLQNSIELTRRNIKSYEDIQKITGQKYASGKTDNVEYLQSKQSLLSEKNKLLNLETGFKETVSSLQNILNVTGGVDEIAFGDILKQKGPAPGLDVPLSVLANRPDLLAAQYRLEGAFEELKAENKNWYPNVSLRGALASGSDKARTTFDFSYILGSVSVDLPFLDWNRVKNNVRISKADYQISLIEFKDTLNQALNEVAYYYYAYLKSLEIYRNVEENYRNSVKITAYYRNRYNYGKEEFKDFLEAVNTENSLRNDLIEQKYQIIKYENYIYKAMAGRYEAVSPAGE